MNSSNDNGVNNKKKEPEMIKYRIVSEWQHSLHGVEFEAESGATEEQIAKAAYIAVAEYLNYGWERAK